MELKRKDEELTERQDTWQTDKMAFSEDELQALNTILVGTSYCKWNEYFIWETTPTSNILPLAMR